MVDCFDKKKRSQIMSNIRSKDTAPERFLFDLVKPLWQEGYRYRKHYRKLPGKPDLAFVKQKIAVFVDSEFWHGKDYGSWEKRLPKKYWREKIKRNIKRDTEVNQKLKALGWAIIRIWSKELKNEQAKIISKLRKKL
ncbi:very short patch repair endonuclease [Patescibacteria group bacterium]